MMIAGLLLFGIPFSSKSQTSFLTLVPDVASAMANIPQDTYVKPLTATASSAQSGEGLTRTYDRNISTLYHSSYNSTVFPVTLDYNFSNSATIDYAVYYPRVDGSLNGNFKVVELFYELWSDRGNFVRVGEYDLGGNSSPFTFNFATPLVAPRTIRFVVKSGAGDNATGFASCAEMEFYKKEADAIDYFSYFTDKSCSRLKPEVTLEDIDAIPNVFYQKLASDLFYGSYDTIFRAQTYKAYPAPEPIAAVWKTNAYGRNDNPTGIYAEKDKDLIVMMASTTQTAPSLFIQSDSAGIGGTPYALKEGVNLIKPAKNGLVYIRYYTPTGTEDPININIVTGGVNGYFDVEKHTADDWAALLGKAVAPYFDLKGRYATMSFETSALKTFTPDGLALINQYDTLVRREQDFMGIYKYGRAVPNRAHFQVVYGDNFMFATSYYMGYNNGTQSVVLSIWKRQQDAWGPAHELGHVHQTRPGLKWRGLTEVTNNIMSQYIVTSFGFNSRLQEEGTYTVAVDSIVKDKAMVAHNASGNYFHRLVPFWQLQLYFADVLGNTDFYKDIYEKVRINPNPTAANTGYTGCTSDGACQLEFVRLACEVSGYDLTKFFADWKFLSPIDQEKEDYSAGRFTVTQTGIDVVKAKIAAMNLPAPPLPAGKELYLITDSNKNTYK